MTSTKKSPTKQLMWRKIAYGEGQPAGFEAKAPNGNGTYKAEDFSWLNDRGYHGAFFRPKQGRSRFPKYTQGLGRFDSVAKAKARCEEHFRALIEDPSRSKAKVAP